MGTVQDASTLNGLTVGSNFFYSVGTSSVSSSGTNGVNTYSGSVAVSGSAGLSGTIADTSSGGNGSFQLTSSTGAVSNYLVLGSSSDSQNLVIQQYTPSTGATGGYYVIANSGTQPTTSISFNSANGYLQPTCFLAGTLILTPEGEKPVERLSIGDLVTTADGEHRPIRWIGSRDYDCRSYIKPVDILPVVILKDAIAPGVPSRDTFLSEGHAVALTDIGPVFVPVRDLINGETIKQVQAETVRYFHLELDSHDVVLANSLPAETYLDCGNRSSLVPFTSPPASASAVSDSVGMCLPRHEGDRVAAALRERIGQRAATVGAYEVSRAA